jgi:hypothetical protein
MKKKKRAPIPTVLTERKDGAKLIPKLGPRKFTSQLIKLNETGIQILEIRKR